MVLAGGLSRAKLYASWQKTHPVRDKLRLPKIKNPAIMPHEVYFLSIFMYDSAARTVIINTLPAEALQTLFNPPVATLPLAESVSTTNGTMTITYYYP